MSNDNVVDYLLESINSNQRVKYTFAFKYVGSLNLQHKLHQPSSDFV